MEEATPAAAAEVTKEKEVLIENEIAAEKPAEKMET